MSATRTVRTSTPHTYASGSRTECERQFAHRDQHAPPQDDLSEDLFMHAGSTQSPCASTGEGSILALLAVVEMEAALIEVALICGLLPTGVGFSSTIIPKAASWELGNSRLRADFGSPEVGHILP
jgi:hypothetical protein